MKFLLVSFFVSLQIFAQSKITGNIECPDSYDFPIAKITILPGNITTNSDYNGRFTFSNVIKGKYKIAIEKKGYKTLTDTINILNNEHSFNYKLYKEDLKLNDVVVTGSLFKHSTKDSPIITEIISNKDINNASTQDLTNILKDQSGIEIGLMRSGKNQGVQLQGLSSKYVLILIDGQRVTGKINEVFDIGQIPVNIIDHIEIIKGPSSALYGSEALGGVINVITKKQTSLGVGARLNIGSNGLQDYILSTSVPFNNSLAENDNLLLNLSGNWNKYFGVDYNTSDLTMELPEYDKKSLTLKSNYSVNKIKFDFFANYYEDKYNWLSGGDALNFFRDNTANKRYSINSVLTYSFTALNQLQISFNHSQNAHDYWKSVNDVLKTNPDRSTDYSESYKAQYMLSPYTSSLLAFGYEMQSDKIESDRVENHFKKYQTHNIYFEDEWKIDNYTLSIGSRYTHNESFGNFFAPKISFSYQYDDNFMLRASYGKGFRAPSIKEMFIHYYITEMASWIDGNSNLKPEKSEGYNLGAEYYTSDYSLRLNGYYNVLNNLILDYLVNPQLFSYTNIDKARVYGYELNAGINLFKKYLVLDASYNYTKTEKLSSDTTSLGLSTPNTSKLKITFNFEDYGSFIAKISFYDNNTYVLADESFNIPSRKIIDLTLIINMQSFIEFKNIKKDAIKLNMGITNLSNVTSYPFGQIKGREFFGGISINL